MNEGSEIQQESDVPVIPIVTPLVAEMMEN